MILDRRTALVTGGSRGIGRAIAEALAAEGARVAINYRNSAAAAEEVVAAIRARGGEALAIQADVADGQQATRLVEQAVEAFGGRLDILVNNAGITRDALLLRMKPEQWDEVLDTNLRSLFFTCKAAARVMLRQRAGRIINIASVVGLTGNAGQVNYVAAKAGVIGFTRALARELGSRGITVNAIAPGLIATDMTEQLSAEHRGALEQRIALGRLGTPEDVAHAAVFLASDRAAYITGQVLVVDGGLS
ncbi:MAG TPA: 3-oxoacyl-[acyl-carrier-protein] reductase, partial [Thermaerobacter sp.]